MSAAGADVYDELGVRKVINGLATVTVLGGSIMPPEVIRAMAEASRHFVEIDELQARVGERIAAWTHNEAAYVCCGAAAGIVLSAAACMAGLDAEKRDRLPDATGMKDEIIVQRPGIVGYAQAIRHAGARIVLVGDDERATVGELEAAISERTAAIFYFYNESRMAGQAPLEECIALARRHGVPVIVDAAAQIPPVENLWRFTSPEQGMGADLAIFSGGKGLCGPQSSGLIVGRRELVEACAFHACPRMALGRTMKVGKEEIVGLMAAVRWYLGLDHAALMRTYEEQVQYVIDAFAGQPHVTARRNFPSEAGQPMPRAELLLDEAALGVTRDAALDRLRRGEPAIALAAAGDRGLFINPQTLQPGQERIICARLREVLGI
ncbi:MAG: L-seryl-tRNA(Sec) selenium transferase [Chloroflexi bacterium ADurb.Bin325]|nr:MAG: L-seryl-tRNA(Sec) selenium transferase [Chloroflexi bacterium ADurb.Bin325]